MITSEIYNLIRALGIHGTYRGYHYLALAISLILQDEANLLQVTKNLYPKIAEAFHTTPKCVERNLRTVVSVCWERGNRELLQEIAGYQLQFKPTTGEFIDMLAGNLKQTMESAS